MEMEREKIEEQAHAHEAGVAENHVNTLHSEADLSDRDEASEDHHDHDDHHVDYSNFTKQQLADLIKDLAKDENFKKVDNILREIKPLYDDMREKERADALMKFVEQGGTAEDFEFKGDEIRQYFRCQPEAYTRSQNAVFQTTRRTKDREPSRRNKNFSKNFACSLIHKTPPISLSDLKNFKNNGKRSDLSQDRRQKRCGQIIMRLLDRFYDNQSIYFELKELDRKKNLEAKLELCARAEKLVRG